MITTGCGQSMEHMCESLWVRCNGAHVRCWMSSATPLFIRRSGSKGMRLRLRMEVCLGLLLSRTCRFLWKRVQRRRFL